MGIELYRNAVYPLKIGDALIELFVRESITLIYGQREDSRRIPEKFEQVHRNRPE